MMAAMVDFGSIGFWVALLQVIGADIVLSGDNAVVIALATRSLPLQQQRQAIFWGTFAAVAMRITLTIVAVTLLKLPALKLIGSLLLLWIAVQLLMPEEESHGDGRSIGNMGAAIRTILVADVVMSTDNIIAIAGAAKGSVLLLAIGLAVSIPLVVFTSTFLLKLMERFPVIIAAGAALLGFVAGEMAVSDPLAAPSIEANAPWLHEVLPVAGAIAVVLLGKLLAARASTQQEAPPLAEVTGIAVSKENGMHKLLLPIDGSEGSMRAVEQLIAMRDWYRQPLKVHLLNVQHVLHKDVGQFVGAAEVQDYHQEQGARELAAARAKLEQAGISYHSHIVTGDIAGETIARFAREQGIDQILMCTHSRSPLGEFVLGSVAKGVIQHGLMPVTLVH
jgi:YjbE family integral membrane protein